MTLIAQPVSLHRGILPNPVLSPAFQSRLKCISSIPNPHPVDERACTLMSRLRQLWLFATFAFR